MDSNNKDGLGAEENIKQEENTTKSETILEETEEKHVNSSQESKECTESNESVETELSIEKQSKNSSDEANLHYENDTCIYTEPESKCQFVWDDSKQEWVPRESERSAVSDKDYDYDGKNYSYTDKETGVKYSWDDVKNEWVANTEKVEKVAGPDCNEGSSEEEDEDTDEKSSKKIKKQDMTKFVYGYENDTHIYTDPSDGSKYFWDKEKNAWFPKVDDDFLAQYQMNYGFVDPNEADKKPEVVKSEPPPPPPSESDNLKRKAPQEPAWFDVGEESTKVYVSGLPFDITETEFVDVMQKCGMVMRDIDTGKMKVKIYFDPETSLPKGDALCTYIKKESVDLALDLLDGYEVRNHCIKVERAKFTMKGNAYDPSLKPKKKRKKDKEKLKKIQEKLFDWRPDKLRGERSKHEQIVIIKNLFDPVDFNKDVKLILEYQQDLREECLKCGAVKKVIIYDRHPEGVAQVSFKEVEAADACVQLLNGRWFGQRQITAATWDGKTKYKMSETDEQIKARLQKWEKFLETGEEAKESGKENTISKEKPEEKVKTKEDSDVVSENTKMDTTLENLESDLVTVQSDEIKRDSDQDTRSSVGSDYDTDNESKSLDN